MIEISEIEITEKCKASMVDIFAKTPEPKDGITKKIVRGFKISELEILQEITTPTGDKRYSWFISASAFSFAASSALSFSYSL
ncbi:MAG: hypothetical protein LLG37_04045 [Spirochaetia bacterium]|nr:hypothetical protein [Spirochaetia bacterium]